MNKKYKIALIIILSLIVVCSFEKSLLFVTKTFKVSSVLFIVDARGNAATAASPGNSIKSLFIH